MDPRLTLSKLQKMCVESVRRRVNLMSVDKEAFLNSEWLNALFGGALIGVAASLMLLWTGRVAGVSGIVYGVIRPKLGDLSWRVSFVAGLIMGGVALRFFGDGFFGDSSLPTDWTVPLAGLLVGFGTVLGSGCTSGHGVCGISRLSPRSLIATGAFILSGVLSVWILKNIGVLP